MPLRQYCQPAKLLLAYYARLLTSQATQLPGLSRYVAVDAYFAKFSFINPLTQAGFFM